MQMLEYRCKVEKILRCNAWNDGLMQVQARSSGSAMVLQNVMRYSIQTGSCVTVTDMTSRWWICLTTAMMTEKKCAGAAVGLHRRQADYRATVALVKLRVRSTVLYCM